MATLDLLAPWLSVRRRSLVLLGPASELGAAVTRRRDDLALAALAPWREVVPAENLLVELVSHRLGGGGARGAGSGVPAPPPTPPGWPGSPTASGIGTVLTNAVRYADRRDAPTVDVLDAARRLVALDRRHVDRGNAEGFLKSGKQMHEVAEEICRLAGLGRGGERDVHRLLARTRAVADRCALDPRADLGLGEVHFPESPRGRGHRRRRRPAGSLRGGRSAGATARRRGSGSGSGSTTSWS